MSKLQMASYKSFPNTMNTNVNHVSGSSTTARNAATGDAGSHGTHGCDMNMMMVSPRSARYTSRISAQQQQQQQQLGQLGQLGQLATTTTTTTKVNNITTYLHKHNYRLGKVIGEGSYSKVKIATRFQQDGTVSYRLACKIINKRRASDDFVTKFLPREIDVISKIEHKNIIHVYDLVEFDDNVYIFMDWCDKGDLLEYVKARGYIPELKSRFYFRQLLSAVQYIHNLDYAHRDLKCENILMKTYKDQLLISDFGFARSCRENGKRILSTTYCGSAAYASPEILQGIPYNPKLYDLWSLGCVLFIMMTGHMPYDESNVPKMLQAQLGCVLNYPPPSDKKISDLGKAFIRRMLEPDVTRRCNIDQACNHEWVSSIACETNANASASVKISQVTKFSFKNDYE